MCRSPPDVAAKALVTQAIQLFPACNAFLKWPFAGLRRIKLSKVFNALLVAVR
jgi:hypothetical protein